MHRSHRPRFLAGSLAILFLCAGLAGCPDSASRPVNATLTLTALAGVQGTAPNYSVRAALNYAMPVSVGFRGTVTGNTPMELTYTLDTTRSTAFFTTLQSTGLTYPGTLSTLTATVSSITQLDAIITGVPGQAGRVVLLVSLTAGATERTAELIIDLETNVPPTLEPLSNTFGLSPNFEYWAIQGTAVSGLGFEGTDPNHDTLTMTLTLDPGSSYPDMANSGLALPLGGSVTGANGTVTGAITGVPLITGNTETLILNITLSDGLTPTVTATLTITVLPPGGGAWSEVSPAPTTAGDFIAVFYPAVTAAYILAENGVIKSTDGGNNWTTVLASPAMAPVGGSFVDADHGWIFGERTVQFTTNGGASWNTQTSFSPTLDSSCDILQLTMASTTHGLCIVYDAPWLATNDLYAYRTTDGGQTWVGQSVYANTPWEYVPTQVVYEQGSTSVCWLGIQETEYNFPFGFPEFFRLYRSPDGGATWTEYANNPLNDLDNEHMLLARSGDALLAGCTNTNGYEVYQADNAGAPFMITQNGNYQHLRAIKSSPSGQVWLCGVDDLLYQSNDHGNTWDDRSGDLPAGNLRTFIDLAVVDGLRSLLITSNKLYRRGP